MAFLLQFDHWLFEQINSQWTNSFFDAIFPALTELSQFPWLVWGLLPSLLALWIWRSRKKALVIILGIALSAGLADAISYRGIKIWVQRDRPTKVLAEKVILRTHDHSGFSFPSNHAANNFAWATYLGFFFPAARWWFWAIAGLIGFTRIYVGVHFPSDVVGGAIVGLFSAHLARWIISKIKSALDSFRARNSNLSS